MPKFQKQVFMENWLAGLRRFFGTLRVKKIEFTITSEHESDATYAFAVFRWEIEAVEVGTQRTSSIFVEPFGGNVVGLTETDKPGSRK
jgi:hypothetical protein